MKFFGKLPFAMVALSLAISQPATAERIDGPVRRLPAQVESRGSLFEMLFGGPVRSRPRNDLPPAQTTPGAAARTVKITGPSYYDYKPDPLVKVDFAPFTALPQKAAFGPSLTDLTVSEAAIGLEGFDLYAEKDVAQALVDYYSRSRAGFARRPRQAHSPAPALAATDPGSLGG